MIHSSALIYFLSEISDWLIKRERKKLCALLQSTTDRALHAYRCLPSYDTAYWTSGPARWKPVAEPHQPGYHCTDGRMRIAVSASPAPLSQDEIDKLQLVSRNWIEE